jgi:uncharacterized damage-inducible protein DinB
MVDASTARDLLIYMLWADRTMLGAVREVAPEHLTRDAGVSFGSLLGTMAHSLCAQKVWLARFLGQRLERPPSCDDYPDLASWIHGWEETASEIEAFLAGLTDEQLAATITFEMRDLGVRSCPLWQAVVHLINHSTYHRGQIASLLRQMGYAPPWTDLGLWFLERAGGA